MRVTDFVSEIKRVKNFLEFEKLARVIQHGLQDFSLKKIKEESTETNYPSHVLFPAFAQNVTFPEVLESTAKINQEPKRMEFDGAIQNR